MICRTAPTCSNRRASDRPCGSMPGWNGEQLLTDFVYCGHALFRLWPQQRLDCAALVHRAIALSHSLERQDQVEHLPRVDGSGQDEIDQLRKIPTDRRGTAEQTNVTEE